MSDASVKSDIIYIQHMLECIAKINEYTQRDKGTFMASTLVQDAVIRNLQILGDASKKISEETKQSQPDIDWKAISGFRNILVHAYFSVDLDLVWQTLEDKLPGLEQSLSKLVAS